MKRRRTRHRDTPESLATRKQYSLDNPTCELSRLMMSCGEIRGSYTSDRSEIHHIVGASGRVDVVSNLITLCPAIHRWVESEVIVGRLWCLYAKSRKNEINADEFHRCSSQLLAGWLENHRAEWPVCLVPYLGELVKSLE
jgi:5-methylcytosine-specific restriction endonuclease McrA